MAEQTNAVNPDPDLKLQMRSSQMSSQSSQKKFGSDFISPPSSFTDVFLSVLPSLV